MKNLSILFFLLILFACENHQLSPKKIVLNGGKFKYDSLVALSRVVQNIVDEGIVKAQFVGEDGVVPAQWQRYEWLQNNATVDQLMVLTNYPDPVVRCYAFQALLVKNFDKALQVFPIYLEDTTRIETMNGCRYSEMTVRDYLIDLVESNYYLKKKINTKESRILDSILKSQTINKNRE